MPMDTPVSDIYDAWDQACHLTVGPRPIRAIVNGKQASPEYPIRDYARVGHGGQLTASVDWVMPLRGGGPSAPIASGSAKNLLATWLLTQGADMNLVAPFVTSIAKAGAMPLSDILQIKDKPQKLKALQALAQSLDLSVPELHVKHQAQKRAINDRTKHMQSLDLTQVRIREGMFANQDGTPCLQRQAPAAGEAGIAVISSDDAGPWLQHTMSVDEQAVLIAGRCPSTEKKCCQRLQVPAYLEGEPIILDVCMHQLGQKAVKVLDVKSQDVPTAQTEVISVTAFKDEVGATAWDKIMIAPVKVILGLLFYDSEQPKITCPPWGRNFQNIHGKSDKSNPVSCQFHCRVLSSDIKKWLKASGKRGVFTVPKTEDRQLSQAYQVVWLHNMESVQITIAAGAHEKSLGVVRNTRQLNRISKGIRFAKSDFLEAFRQLRPNEPEPTQVSCRFMFKVSPTPKGASSEEMQSWLSANGWTARPIRALSADVWLCGAESPFDDDFVAWNGKPMIIKWIQPKSQNKSWLIAGQPPMSKITRGKPSQEKELPQLQGDPWSNPWGNYQPTGLGSNTRTQNAMPPAITRKLEAPIEERFDMQQKRVEELQADTKKQIDELKASMLGMQSQVETNQSQVKAEFAAVRQETAQQFKEFSSSFGESLKQAMSRQDSALSSQLSELKQMLLSRPTPAKKAKSAPPNQDAGMHEEPNDENL